MRIDEKNYVIHKDKLVRAKTLLTSVYGVFENEYDKESTEYLIHLIDLLLTDYKIDIREHVAEEFLVYYSVHNHEMIREAYLCLLKGIGGLI